MAKLKTTLALIPAAILAACGGDEQTVNEPVKPGSVIYSYPLDGQSQVAPGIEVVLRFSHQITDEDAASKVRLTQGETSIPYTLRKVDSGRSLVLQLQEPLNTSSDYSVTFEEPLGAAGGRTISTPNAQGDDQPGIQFTTRGGKEGNYDLSENFELVQMIPAPGTRYQPMDMSTFRMVLSHPVDPMWKNQGGSIELLDSEGNAVNADIMVKGKRITVDPCLAEEQRYCGGRDDKLNPEESYTLKISNLPSQASDQTFSDEFTFKPRKTGPTVFLVQEALTSNNGDITSELNGAPINGVSLISTLMGTTDYSQQTATMYAELAYTPAFEQSEPLPLRVPRGTLLSSSSLDVKVAGQVSALDAETGEPQKTGDIKVTMISDATGYLLPNPYTDDAGAPSYVKLFMDVSMNTEEKQPNAALSQDLLGVELVGLTYVKEGTLIIDAMGVVEPKLLGQENASSLIAFRIEAETDEDSPADAVEMWAQEARTDSTGPQLMSWTPGPADAIPDTRQSMQRPGDAVILFFDEPLDPGSVEPGVSLTADGQAVTDLNVKLDGTSLTLNPAGGLQHGVAYALQIDGVTDLSGNPAPTKTLDFELDATDTNTPSVPQSSPLALTTYPGYPCETTQAAVNLSAGTHGRCWDAAEDGEAGDVLPLGELPADRPITVVFSQSMDMDSIRLGETFTVEKVTADKSVEETVSGRLEKNNQRIRFYPDSAWEPGSYYRYTMVSAEDGSCSAANKPVICGANGLALQTDILEDSEDIGGQPMTIYFRGTQAQDTVFTPLRNFPVRDTNSNLTVDCPSLADTDCLEPFDHPEDGNGGFLPSANAAKLLVEGQTADGGLLGDRDARVGCRPEDPECPKNKFIYQTYALNSEVIGPERDPETGKMGVGVRLYPSMLATSSSTVWLNLPALFGGTQPSVTGPQILRMRYAKDDPSCTSNCARNSLIPGIIIEGDDGTPIFKTTAELHLDAPNLEAPLNATHNLYSYPFTLELEGDVTFFDDGRMQIEQRNINRPEITVDALALSIATVHIPLFIPEQGVYLNFISSPVKEIPRLQ